MNRLKEKLRTFMIGRYGADQLGRDFSWLVLALCLAKLIVHRGFGAMVLDTFILAGLAVLYFRICSREIGKRSMENQAYLRYRFRAEEWFKRMKFRFQEGRRYHIYKCPGCGQKVRIPRGHGKVSIHCPKCGRDFKPGLQKFYKNYTISCFQSGYNFCILHHVKLINKKRGQRGSYGGVIL